MDDLDHRIPLALRVVDRSSTNRVLHAIGAELGYACDSLYGLLNNGVPKTAERRIPAISRSSPRNSGDRGQRRRSEYGLNAPNFAEFR